jgi:hypothetical protein
MILNFPSSFHDEIQNLPQRIILPERKSEELMKINLRELDLRKQCLEGGSIHIYAGGCSIGRDLLYFRI